MGTRMRLVVGALVATLGVTACGDGEVVGVSPAPTGPHPAVSVAPDTAAPPTSAAAPRTRDPDGRTAALPGADRSPKTSSLQQGSPVLLGVRAGSHPGYTRYVFDFTNDDPEGHSPMGAARPGWDVRYVPPSEAVQDGSGDPPPVGGAVYLRIRFDGAAAHYQDGTASIRYGLDAHSPLGFGGDFEGRVTWFLGLEGQRAFKVSFVAPNKVAVDVVDG